MTAQNRREIVALLERHQVRPNKKLGQNFLVDGNLTRRIAAEAGVGPGDRVVEVGAGTGTLTRALAATGATVLAFEVDHRLRPILEEVLAGLAVELAFDDVTKVDLASRLGEGDWHLVANLPYNVGTPLVLNTLRHVAGVVRLVVMVQREVAERLVSRPGDPDYGLPSVVVGLLARARIAFKVPPHVFYPVPNVASAVVVMDRVTAPPESERAIELARAGFGTRRKMLRSALAGVLDDPLGMLEAAGIDPTRRAESLSPAEFVALARAAG